MSFLDTRKKCSSAFLQFHEVNYRALDTALVDDDAAIRVLNHNIDANGTGFFPFMITAYY
jgi:hypothetical protein